METQGLRRGAMPSKESSSVEGAGQASVDLCRGSGRMSVRASFSGSTMRGVVLLVGLLGATGGCKRPSDLSPLPPPPQASAPGLRAVNKNVAYRAEPGTPIAPSVIPDNPPPAALAAPSPSSGSAAVPR